MRILFWTNIGLFLALLSAPNILFVHAQISLEQFYFEQLYIQMIAYLQETLIQLRPSSPLDIQQINSPSQLPISNQFETDISIAKLKAIHIINEIIAKNYQFS